MIHARNPPSQPLHLATAGKNRTIVESIVEFTKLTLLTRDATGSTPLHIAVTDGFSAITRILVEASPPEALYVENGVGATPLESAQLEFLKDRASRQQNSDVSWLQGSTVTIQSRRWDFKHLQEEVPKYIATVEELSQSGKLRKRTKLANELAKFGETLQMNLEKASAQLAEEVRVEKSDFDTSEYGKTYRYIKERLASHTGERQLVHLIDVQKSVQSHLPEMAKQKKGKRDVLGPDHRDEHGFDAEEDTEAKERNGSFAITYS